MQAKRNYKACVLSKSKIARTVRAIFRMLCIIG